MTDVWKSDGSDIYVNAMVWAQSLELVLNGPLANASGTVYMGYLPFGSLLSSDSVTQEDYSVGDLINQATQMTKMTG